MNKKVLLIAPLFERYDYPLYFPSENLGIGYIAAYLRSKGIEVDIMDANMMSIKSEDVINEINLDHYFLVGISSSFEKLLNESVVIAESIKKKNPIIHISIGGHYPTFQHKAILGSYHCFNSVARCDGEIIIYNLANAILNNTILDNVKGLTFRNNKNEIIINEEQELVKNLDELPWPARDTQKLLQNKRHSWATQIATTRGCYGNCFFCDISVFYNKKWRARSVIDVVNEIDCLITKYGCKTFRFTDDEFFGSSKEGKLRALEFAKEVIKRKLKVNFMISARAEDVDYELFSYLAQAGVNDCLIGIESASNRILKIYNKRTTVEQNIKAFQILRQLNINLNLAFIMFDPRMTLDELKNNYEFLKVHEALTIDALRSRFWALYGTPSILQLEREGLITEKTINDIKYEFIDKKVQIIFDKINELCIKCYKIDYLIRSYVMNGNRSEAFDTLNEKYLKYWVDYFAILLQGRMIEANDEFLTKLILELEELNETFDNIFHR